MDVSTRVHDESVVVTLAGEVDLETSPRVREVLLGAVSGGQPVFVHLEAVSYIDSSGIASLVEAYQRARDLNTRFGLISVNEAAARVLRLSRLDTVFPIFGSVDEALNGDG